MVVASSKEVVVHFGSQRCRLLLFEGSDSPSLNFALNSRLRLEGAPFHLTERGDETLVPLSAALPGGLELVLHLGSQDLQMSPDPEEALDAGAGTAAAVMGRGVPAPSFSEDPTGGEKGEEGEAEGEDANQAVMVFQDAAESFEGEEREGLSGLRGLRPLAPPLPMKSSPSVSDLCAPTLGSARGQSEGGSFAPSLEGMRESLLQPHPEAPGPDESLQLGVDHSRQHARTASFSNSNELQAAEPQIDQLGADASQRSSIEHIEMATTRLDRFSRLNTDLANERTLLAWVRTAMSVIRTAFAFLAVSSEVTLWLDWVFVTRLFMVTLVLVSTLSGISRYHCVKKATFQDIPPQHFGRVSILWFNGTSAGCAIATVAAMYLNAWHKI